MREKKIRGEILCICQNKTMKDAIHFEIDIVFWIPGDFFARYSFLIDV